MLIRMGLGTQLSGSTGGVVASRNRSGAYLRARTVPINPRSNRQQQQRAGFQAASLAWRTLTVAQRTAWENYAAETPVLNRLGESITLSGQGMYIRTNAFLAGVGLPQIAAAPPTPGASTLGTPAINAVTVTPDEIGFVTVGATATRPESAIIQMGPSISPGVKSFGGPYSLFASGVTMLATGFTAEPQTVTNLRYGNPVTGQRRPVRIRSMDSAGRLSDTFETIVTVG